jgi:hypothetical protein
MSNGTSAYVSIHTSAYGSIRQHTAAYGSIRQHTAAYGSIRQHTSAYGSIRQHTAAYGSIRQHTAAYGSIRQHTSVENKAAASENTKHNSLRRYKTDAMLCLLVLKYLTLSTKIQQPKIQQPPPLQNGCYAMLAGTKISNVKY